MGLLWWKSKGKSEEKATQKPDPKPTEVPGMNGAVEVPRRPPSDVTVFEFGSVANSADKVTLAGYCPVSDELEPCRWEILPAKDSGAPQFRIVFWNFFTCLLFWCFDQSIRNVSCLLFVLLYLCFELTISNETLRPRGGGGGMFSGFLFGVSFYGRIEAFVILETLISA